MKKSFLLTLLAVATLLTAAFGMQAKPRYANHAQKVLAARRNFQ